MNQITTPNETKKQGRVMRLVTAVFKKLFKSISVSSMSMSPYASQEFYYSSYGWEEVNLYESMLRAKLDEEDL